MPQAAFSVDRKALAKAVEAVTIPKLEVRQRIGCSAHASNLAKTLSFERD